MLDDSLRDNVIHLSLFILFLSHFGRVYYDGGCSLEPGRVYTNGLDFCIADEKAIYSVSGAPFLETVVYSAHLMLSVVTTSSLVSMSIT